MNLHILKKEIPNLDAKKLIASGITRLLQGLFLPCCFQKLLVSLACHVSTQPNATTTILYCFQETGCHGRDAATENNKLDEIEAATQFHFADHSKRIEELQLTGSCKGAQHQQDQKGLSVTHAV